MLTASTKIPMPSRTTGWLRSIVNEMAGLGPGFAACSELDGVVAVPVGESECVVSVGGVVAADPTGGSTPLGWCTPGVVAVG